MTDLFTPLTPPNLGAARRRKCVRHDWTWAGPTPESGERCRRCDRVRDDQLSRRGRNNRARGGAIEREVGKQLGLKRVGQFGGATDLGVSADPFAVSVKSGSGYFSERYWDQLKRQPVAAGQTALLVVTDAPGPGHRRRAVVVLDLTDWLALHGPSGVEGLA
jgi:hypothetical protein